MKQLLVVLAVACSQTSAWAQVGAADPAAPRGAGMENGEVRRIDKEQGKVSLRHGELKSIDMPPMTMAFAVADPRQLDALKVGSRVAFKVIKKPDGSLLVTDIKPLP